MAELVAQPNLDPLARRAAAETLADYGYDKGAVIANALVQSELPTFQVLFAVAVNNSEDAVMRFEQELAEAAPPNAPIEELQRLNIRKSRAAAGLARLGRAEQVWPLLVFDPQSDDLQSQDPSLRTEVLHALAEYRVPVQRLVDRLSSGLPAAQNGSRNVQETSIQRALLLALGGYTSGMSEKARHTVIEQLQLRTVFETDPDPGIHSACELLLRRWGEKSWLRRAQQKLKTQAHRPPVPQANEPRRWFVNSQGQGFVVFPPGTFKMGSPVDEQGRYFDELQHRRRIERSFAIASTEVTRAQYAAFARATGIEQRVTPFTRTLEDPQTLVS